jgi:hypothetical protein
MAKPTRSPLLGYNHNVKYGGHVFHVQTEDSGPQNPHIFTHLFFEGSILGSKRCQYDPAATEDEVRGLMQGQHKAILKELKQKNYDERITHFFEARGLTFRSEDFFADAPPPAPATPEVAAPSEVIADDSAITMPVGTPEQAPGPVVEPATEAMPEPPPPVAAQPVAAAEPALLDLDALPVVSGEKGPTPEPLPIHLTKPAVPGPGTYTFRRPSRDDVASDTPSPQRLPAIPGRPGPSRPITPVVVQRQVVVGAGGPPATNTRKIPTTPVRRRPVSGGPYVVKEGSHANVAGTVRRAESTRPVGAAPDPAQAPRTAEPPPAPQTRSPQEATPPGFVTDQSLDDVILAYLSQGDGKH